MEGGAANERDTADKTVELVVIESNVYVVAVVALAQAETAAVVGDGDPVRVKQGRWNGSHSWGGYHLNALL